MPQYSGVWSLQQQMQALTSGQWATDPLFDYTTLLLQGDAGANGAQNNVFYDTSPNQFAITRNGNTTQGTFSPFSLQPGAWANFFEGSSAQLSIANSTNLDLGSGNWTIEAWLFPTAFSGNARFFSKQVGSGNGYAFRLQPTSGYIYAEIDTVNFLTSTVSPALNTWSHVAIVRNSNTVTIYLNGVSIASASYSSTPSSQNAPTTISGYDIGGVKSEYFPGYISNLRFVKGTAVYTSNFTPSTTPLTAVTNTQLLTCQSNRFVDNSTNAFSITLNGAPSVQAFSPFAPQFQYTASVTGGSGYFDGGSDYLSIADNAALQFSATTVFTVEAWVYPTGVSAQQGIIVKRGSSGTQEWGLLISSSGNALFGGNSANLTGTTAIRANTWNHIAASSDGTTVSLYLNGAREGTATASSLGITSSTNAVLIGYQTTTVNPFTGWIASSRVVKGTQVYSGTTYTVPTAPLTAVTNTSLLCNFTNAGILDGTMKNNLETVNNAQVSTSVVKYGSGSLAFDGTGDALFSVYNPNLNLGSGDFTIEGWVYFSALPSNNYVTLASYGNSTSTQRWLFYYDTRTSQSSPGLRFSVINASNTLIVDVVGGGTTGWAANTWYHVAITRSGNSWKMFRDGTQNGSTVTDTDAIPDVTANGLVVGAEPDKSTAAFNGYLDDLRITKGIARYTQNFIPPSVALPRQ